MAAIASGNAGGRAGQVEGAGGGAGGHPSTPAAPGPSPSCVYVALLTLEACWRLLMQHPDEGLRWRVHAAGAARQVVVWVSRAAWAPTQGYESQVLRCTP